MGLTAQIDRALHAPQSGTRKHIQVVMVGPGGEETPILVDEPVSRSEFTEVARAAIRREVLELAQRAGENLGLGEFRVPKIVEKKMRRAAAGTYKPQEHTVYLNMLLLETPADYRQTFAHETAHAVVSEALKDRIANRKWVSSSQWSHHGLIWRDVLRSLGARDESTHELDVVAKMPDKYLSYTCPCGFRHQVGKRALANAVAKGARWSCGTCRRPIDLAAFAPTPRAAGGKRRHATARQHLPPMRSRRPSRLGALIARINGLVR